jgi:Ca-activated chloride channel family protein
VITGRNLFPCVAIFLALISSRAFSQDAEPPTIRVNVKLVNVFVNATDSKGVPVPNLTRDDFSLTEDGVPQQIKVFEKQSEQPLSIVLAVDTSGSVRKDWHEEMASASRFLHTLVRPVDKVELLEFSTHVRQVVPFTNKVKAVDAGMKDLKADYATALYEAVETAAENLRQFEGRKIIVIVSDGGNTTKGTTYDDAFRAAISAEASVYSLIDVPVEASAGRELGGEHAMITLAEDTGGKFYYGGNPEQLEASFKQLSDDLRTQYLLGYYPVKRAGAEDFRHIGVTLVHTGNTTPTLLRYRPGYFASQPVTP